MLIAHLADLHLGFRAYHRATARGVNARELDVADAFRRAVDRLVEIRPDLVLVAGDVFHTVRPANAAIAHAFRHFSRLTAALPESPVVVVAGNHDSPRSTETAHILSLFREIPGMEVVTDSADRLRLPQLNASVLCLPHLAVAQRPAAEPSTAEIVPDARAATNLLLLHGRVTGPAADRELRRSLGYGGAPIDERDIQPERWDYVALGHHHMVTELAPNMWYPGALERTSANLWAEARGPKGFLTFDTGEGRASFHPIETRPVVDLAPVRARGRSAAEVDEAIRAAVESVEGGLAGKIIRLVIQDVPRHVLRELNHRRIREYKAEALHFHLDARPPETVRPAAAGAALRRQTLGEQVEAYLTGEWRLSADDLDRERVVELGRLYLEQVAEAGGDG
jgi:DNA repair protein SbcD/Mre11